MSNEYQDNLRLENRCARTPLLIGITGHRDLRSEDEPLLREQLRSIFSTLRARYRSTPFLLLSSLAEGADRLAARVALECGAELCTVLPMPLDYYMRDFTSDHSIEEFQELYSHSSGTLFIPLGEGIEETSLLEASIRNVQYIQASLFIARYSHILIALWDGRSTPSPGGTSYAVHARLEGSSEFNSAIGDPLDPPTVGMVYHIVTPRRSAPPLLDATATLKILYPPTSPSPHHYQAVLELLDEYNTDIHRILMAEEKIQSGSPCRKVFDAIKDDPDAEDFYRRFAAADALAVHYQQRTRRVFIGLFVLVFIAATAFDIYAHLHYWTGKVGLFGYIAIFTVAYLWYHQAYRKRYQTKYLDYRAVAEGMRIQFHWYLAGIEQMVGEHYLRKQKSELDWIRYVLNAATIVLRSKSSRAHHSSLMQRLEHAHRNWVQSQCVYFTNKHLREARQLGRFHRGINLTFGAAFLLAIVQLAINDTYAIIIPMGLLPVVAALLVGYIEKIGLHGHIKSSTFMADLFQRAERRVDAMLRRGDHRAAQQLLVELGKEALRENADWLLYHRERPLEVPKG